MTDDETISRVVEKSLHDLGEHFESVQILVSRVVEGSTHTVFKGVGNWHARVGMCHEFLNKEMAMETASQLADKIKPEGE
jgi:hypothetical protein